jgi:hypothetical protein
MREVIGRKSRAEVSPRQNNIIYLKNNKSKKKKKPVALKWYVGHQPWFKPQY